jgi:glutamate synthase (NADPH/NADH) large chain
MVRLERLAPPHAGEDSEMHSSDKPRQRSVSVSDAGMGDLLRFDAERLRILIERHLLYTGSARARALLDNWEETLSRFVKVMPLDYAKALAGMAAERHAKAVAAE